MQEVIIVLMLFCFRGGGRKRLFARQFRGSRRSGEAKSMFHIKIDMEARPRLYLDENKYLTTLVNQVI